MKTSTLLNLSLTAALASATAAHAAERLPMPTGHNILPHASNCNLGPFEQTSKAGGYNGLCDALTDAEKCLALLKENMTHQTGELRRTADVERVAYCLEEFRRGLLGE